ncbi:hypothetical protein [Pararhizobium arenae]|uniref:hypothetical protein n=1 Tax=Pararhizobium arenae TaxID=1856850 RepID=UPI00094AF328|nr:hypothetical protein [Pararhizobium arenae]
MSSNNLHNYLETSHIIMLNRVLERADYFGPESKVDVDTTRQAARFLLKIFQSGVDSEDDLVAALDARGKSVEDGGDTPRQVRLEAVNRWADDGGQSE